jgi:hypothetical protein
MKFLIAVVLIINGVIATAQSGGRFGVSIPVGTPNPSWMNWWPANLGRSWFLSQIGMEQPPVYWISGLLWIIGGIALVAAGLGVFGFIIPSEWWRTLAIVGAAISLFLMVIYLHPMNILGMGLNIAILVALLWAHWPTTSIVP